MSAGMIAVLTCVQATAQLTQGVLRQRKKPQYFRTLRKGSLSAVCLNVYFSPSPEKIVSTKPTSRPAKANGCTKVVSTLIIGFASAVF